MQQPAPFPQLRAAWKKKTGDEAGVMFSTLRRIGSRVRSMVARCNAQTRSRSRVIRGSW
jgi:hypothetical protein